MIKELTLEQESKISDYLKKWLDVGYRTDSIDREKAEESVNLVYEKILKVPRPKHYIFLDSPMQCQMAMNLLKQVSSKLNFKLNSKLNSQLAFQLGFQLASRINSQLASRINSQLASQLGSQLASRINSQLASRINSQLASQLGSQLAFQLDSQLGFQLGSRKEEYFYPSTSNWWTRSGYGYYYFGTYDYILNVLFPEKASQAEFVLFNEYMLANQSWHQVYMCNEIVFFSDFPKTINLNKENRLHSHESMALEYRDGWGIYALNGILVPKEVALLRPEEITKDHILKQANADHRREIVRKLSGMQLFNILNPRFIDEKYGYELLSINLGDERERPFLKMNNPSIEAIHIEGVGPNCENVLDAIEFRNGRPGFPITLDGLEIFTEELGDYFQQGDCLFSIEKELPKGATPCDHNVAGDGLIRHIQSGGHLYEKDGNRYLVVNENKEARISHPEHKDTVLTEGVYRISKVLEYSHWDEEAREVID